MIRSELRPPKRDKKTVYRLTKLAEQVVAAVDSGMPRDSLITEFNAATHRTFTVGDFMGATSSITMREFARGALMPEPCRVEGVTKKISCRLFVTFAGNRPKDSYQNRSSVFTYGFWRPVFHIL